LQFVVEQELSQLVFAAVQAARHAGAPPQPESQDALAVVQMGVHSAEHVAGADVGKAPIFVFWALVFAISIWPGVVAVNLVHIPASVESV